MSAGCPWRESNPLSTGLANSVIPIVLAAATGRGGLTFTAIARRHLAGALAHRGNADIPPAETGAHHRRAAPTRHHGDAQEGKRGRRGGGSGTGSASRSGDSPAAASRSVGSVTGANGRGTGGASVTPASARTCSPWQRQAHSPAAQVTRTFRVVSPVDDSGTPAGAPQQPVAEGSSFSTVQQHFRVPSSGAGQPQGRSAGLEASESTAGVWAGTERTLTGKGKPIAPAR